MTSCKHYALIRFISDGVFSVCPVYRMIDFKKMLPHWIKCKNEEEFDKFFNPVEADRNGVLESANLIMISEESLKLREYCIQYKANLRKGTTDTSNDNLRKRKASQIDQTASTSNCNLNMSSRPKDSQYIVSAQPSKRAARDSDLRTQPPERKDNYSYEMEEFDAPTINGNLPDVSTPKGEHTEMPILNISQITMPKSEHSMDEKEEPGIVEGENLTKACAANFSKIYKMIADIQETLNSVTASKVTDTSEMHILIGGKYSISKSAVAYGLAKSSLERFFRELIASGWQREEKAGHNLTGLGSKCNLKINSEKLNSYIDYSINAWNNYHNKNNPGSCLIVPSHQLDAKRKALRSLMGLICQEETRKANKVKE